MIIVDIDMPKDCWTCRIESAVNNCPCKMGVEFAVDHTDQRSPNCPIKKLPRRYGRLVDADALEKQLSGKEIVMMTSEDVRKCIKDAHTIVEKSLQ